VAVGPPAPVARAHGDEPAARSPAAAAAQRRPAGGDEEDDDDEPLLESRAAELRRLEATVGELSETNDRIMAQNIALLADLEVAQRAVRELRADKDALAVQLKRALLDQQQQPPPSTTQQRGQ
jgi:small-conductance mechanosensitive channel